MSAPSHAGRRLASVARALTGYGIVVSCALAGAVSLTTLFSGWSQP